MQGRLENLLAPTILFYFRIQLSAPPTSTAVSSDFNGFYKEGFILTISLKDGSVGFGEVSNHWKL